MQLLPPAPKSFKAPGRIQWARFALTPPKFFRVRRFSGRRLAGLKYEQKAQDMLSERFPEQYVPGPWLYFLNDSGAHWCQPDGILIDVKAGVIVIVEMKYQHTTDAWWQMRELYQKVLMSIFPESLWTFKVLEVVKWYDPAVRWPERICLLAKPEAAFSIPSTSTGVHIWTP